MGEVGGRMGWGVLGIECRRWGQTLVCLGI